MPKVTKSAAPSAADRKPRRLCDVKRLRRNLQKELGKTRAALFAANPARRALLATLNTDDADGGASAKKWRVNAQGVKMWAAQAETFVVSLVSRASDIARASNARSVTLAHIKAALRAAAGVSPRVRALGGSDFDMSPSLKKTMFVLP